MSTMVIFELIAVTFRGLNEMPLPDQESSLVTFYDGQVR